MQYNPRHYVKLKLIIMKQAIVVSVTAVVFLFIGVLAGKTAFKTTVPCNKQHMCLEEGTFLVSPSDTVRGKATFNVYFYNNGTGLDNMYPEEIANSLITDKWQYNEMLELKERAE
jgi:hypothetical protein